MGKLEDIFKGYAVHVTGRGLAKELDLEDAQEATKALVLGAIPLDNHKDDCTALIKWFRDKNQGAITPEHEEDCDCGALEIREIRKTIGEL